MLAIHTERVFQTTGEQMNKHYSGNSVPQNRKKAVRQRVWKAKEGNKFSM